ncbi:MAG: hypothetical protein GTO40_22880 [Deltaproteobacteria bacterium]|nr:hypothetical protein [Deltaproteobacteria bacterium]
MDLQKINLKLFVKDPDGVPLTAFVPIFHSWIQATDGEYHDVADYSHMHAGPGILLVAHEANLSIDNAGNRLGLLYNRKQLLDGTNGEKLRTVAKTALEYCRKIEEEPSLDGKFRFAGQEALFIVNDRLQAPNTEETFDAVKPELESLGHRLFGGAKFTLHREADPQQRFAVRLKSSESFDTATLLANLGEVTDS